MNTLLAMVRQPEMMAQSSALDADTLLAVYRRADAGDWACSPDFAAARLLHGTLTAEETSGFVLFNISTDDLGCV
jgi:hypothetical protein